MGRADTRSAEGRSCSEHQRPWSMDHELPGHWPATGAPSSGPWPTPTWSWAPCSWPAAGRPSSSPTSWCAACRGARHRRRRHRPGRLLRGHPRDHPRRPGLRTPRGHPLRRRQHPRRRAPHLHLRPDQRHPPLRGRGGRAGRALSGGDRPDPGAGGNDRGRPGHQPCLRPPGRWRCRRPRCRRAGPRRRSPPGRQPPGRRGPPKAADRAARTGPAGPPLPEDPVAEAARLHGLLASRGTTRWPVWLKPSPPALAPSPHPRPRGRLRDGRRPAPRHLAPRRPPRRCPQQIDRSMSVIRR